jgi:hypothetical protein
LSGRSLEIQPCLDESAWADGVLAFSPDTRAGDDAGLFQDREMLAHALPGKAGIFGELDN